MDNASMVIEGEIAAERVRAVQAPKMTALRAERYGERRVVEREELPAYGVDVGPPEYEEGGLEIRQSWSEMMSD